MVWNSLKIYSDYIVLKYQYKVVLWNIYTVLFLAFNNFISHQNNQANKEELVKHIYWKRVFNYFKFLIKAVLWSVIVYFNNVLQDVTLCQSPRSDVKVRLDHLLNNTVVAIWDPFIAYYISEDNILHILSFIICNTVSKVPSCVLI